MLTRLANIHRSVLPAPGAIVVVKIDCELRIGHRYRKFIVESFPLCDSADSRYSIGIHTVNLRALDNDWRCRVSGFYCEELS